MNNLKSGMENINPEKGIKVPDLDDNLSSIKEEIQKALKNKKSGEKHGITIQGTIPVDKAITSKDIKIKQGKDRVATGIPGLDEIMGGGFEQGSVNIIGGGPGSGKSIFCMQFLVDGARMFNEKGIYITFEESSKNLKKHLKEFGWDLEELEKQEMITILEYAPDQANQVLEEGGGIIDSIIERTKPKRIVIDSLTAFTLLYKDELSKIQASLKFFKIIQKWDCTALLTAETDLNADSHKSTIMEFEVDGVLLLYNTRKDDTRERALEILKLRGIHHSTKIFPIKISDSGIEVF